MVKVIIKKEEEIEGKHEDESDSGFKVGFSRMSCTEGNIL